MNAHVDAPIGIPSSPGQRISPSQLDEYQRYTTARDQHWNLTGPESRGLQPIFDALFRQIPG